MTLFQKKGRAPESITIGNAGSQVTCEETCNGFVPNRCHEVIRREQHEHIVY